MITTLNTYIRTHSNIPHIIRCRTEMLHGIIKESGLLIGSQPGEFLGMVLRKKNFLNDLKK